MTTEDKNLTNGADSEKDKSGEGAPQKKRITAVFRPQNIASGTQRRQGGGQARPSGQSRPAQPSGSGQAKKSSGTGSSGSRTSSSTRNGNAGRTQAPAPAPRRPITEKAPGQIIDRASRHNAEKIDQMLAERMKQEAEEKRLREEAAARAAEEAARAEKEAQERAAAEAAAAKEAAKRAAEEAAARAAEEAAKAAQKEEAAAVQEQSAHAQAEKKPAAARGAESRGQGERTSQPRTEGRGQGDRGQGGRGGEGRGQGDRTGGRTGEGRNQGDRPFGGRTGEGRGQGDRSQSGRTGEGRSQGDRSFGGRSSEGRGQGDRSQSGRTGEGRSQGDRSFGGRGAAGQGAGRSQGGFAGKGASSFGGGFNKDKDERETRPGQNSRRNYSKSSGAGQAEGLQKPSSTRKAKPAPKANDRYEKQRQEEEDFKGLNRKGAFHMPQPKQETVSEEIKTLVLPETLTLKELADKMKIQPSMIIKKLFMQGKVVTVNQELDYSQAEEIAMEYDILCEPEVKVNVLEELLKDTEDPEDQMVPRPPVVCVMGHVDHGKTSLLDAIRETNVTSREAGGITQHIGAYQVEINGREITFLDTPGHEAFTAMRMRGAQSTDIAVLVVAADDGVMPQTVEAINHAKAANVEIIVAINKIDKPNANIDRVKQELTEHGLIPEDWGGTTICAPVSAHTKEGIDNLLEMILLTADLKELKANPNRKARGLIIEAKLDKGKGPVATVLIQKGTLHVGDSIAAGSCFGKVRAMMDDKGRRVKEATPSTPVEILGFNDVPGAGEICIAMDGEKEARAFAETFISEGREQLIKDTRTKMSLDDLFSQIKAGNLKELHLIVKADVQGSVEAVQQSLLKLSNEEVVVKIIHSGAGAINESDVTLASASNAIIIGFNVKPDPTAKSIAETEKVDIRTYSVIYQAIEDVEAAMKGMLDPVYEEQVIGHAMVRQLFKASGVGTIAGSYVLDGKFTRGCKVRISREGKQIFEGNLASLKRFKDDVREVAKGYECGLVIDGFNEVAVDDTIEAYIMVEVPR